MTATAQDLKAPTHLEDDNDWRVAMTVEVGDGVREIVINDNGQPVFILHGTSARRMANELLAVADLYDTIAGITDAGR